MIFLNGALVNEEEARINPADRGLLLGDGVFETLRANHGRVMFEDKHFERLMRGLDILEISPAYSIETMKKGIRQVIEANLLVTTTAALRITITRGAGPRGLLFPEVDSPTLLITGVELQARESTSVQVGISPFRRNESSPLAGIKSLSYGENVLARRKVQLSGFDEALLLNTAGALAGGSYSNVFIVSGGHVLTPRLADGALPGIVRQAILEQPGMILQEARLTSDDLHAADEVFLTNSLIGILPVASIDHRSIGNGAVGKVTSQLRTWWQEQLLSAP